MHLFESQCMRELCQRQESSEIGLKSIGQSVSKFKCMGSLWGNRGFKICEKIGGQKNGKKKTKEMDTHQSDLQEPLLQRMEQATWSEHLGQAPLLPAVDPPNEDNTKLCLSPCIESSQTNYRESSSKMTIFTQPTLLALLVWTPKMVPLFSDLISSLLVGALRRLQDDQLCTSPYWAAALKIVFLTSSVSIFGSFIWWWDHGIVMRRHVRIY